MVVKNMKTSQAENWLCGEGEGRGNVVFTVAEACGLG
jgi:hypothetical protein